ncbi:carboxylesterase/lipase family protein [Phenylobacterium sp. J367]|uniref:carboxylesterase/lipase family protein n=1 Tax=Phenylobacterium sp. J367 TaxID=2898435 RepID=UPI00215120AB|nr:carboxylesterase/lipase family protein [Phenylobacterium sp. J367]MCR5879761.1 carboxylesterase/lipase family protein [Phenylobacterium sp. J367]
MDRRTLITTAAAGLILPSVAARAADHPVARTTAGRVRGYTDGGIKVFKGIRYGADTAPRRFQPPAPPAPWTGVADALAYGSASPQPGAEPAQSEDCLFLNVWAPGLRDGARRPVMVYFHGGAYSTGSGSSPLYDGTRLARRGDVVVVTVNHRLNAFGYAYLARLGVPDWADSGNAGQLDLVLALRWVRDNIAEFGGDASRVMVFGQSGGGAKIATLMAMPAAQGLFHRAATMSGQQVTASGPLNAHQRTLAWLDALKLKPEQADALRTLPAQRLVEAMGARDPILPYGAIYFGPVLDERSLRRHPFWPDAPPLAAGVPMIIGNTHDETRAFLGNDESNFTLDWAGLPARLAPNLRVDIQPELVIARYRELYPHYSPSDVLFSATTASRSWRGAIIEAEARARQGAPTWAYQLDFPSPSQGGRLKAFHTLDIPLVFDNTAAKGAQTGDGPEARKVAGLMSDAFIALARTGDPNHAALPRWEPYGLPRRQTMVFDAETRLVDDPRGAERELFAKVPYVQPGT